ncbi:hypothetical protein CAC42_7733 [Sphaceloma murrayae]|uniref:26S proteasome complex subunit SEM1 n=1 Tax=Sphaceloma murrayae TaxID=2082308 RepID=A0A2K1QXI1_9PEZI|nr:hypothetical protein CAC42_7733 [Sphaceloma murrayae]
MSGAAQGDASTSKGTVKDTNDTSKPLQPKTNPTQLEEDDEFEDFPVEDWPADQELGAQTASAQGVAQSGPGGQPATTHLWEESWDDDDTSDDFASQLKEELAKAKK